MRHEQVQMCMFFSFYDVKGIAPMKTMKLKKRLRAFNDIRKLTSLRLHHCSFSLQIW